MKKKNSPLLIFFLYAHFNHQNEMVNYRFKLTFFFSNFFYFIFVRVREHFYEKKKLKKSSKKFAGNKEVLKKAENSNVIFLVNFDFFSNFFFASCFKCTFYQLYKKKFYETIFFVFYSHLNF